MLVGMDMDLAIMLVGMEVDQVIVLQKLYIGQDLGGGSAPYYLLIAAEDIYDIRYLLDYMHVVRSGDYRLPISVVLVQKTDKIS